MHSRTVTSVSQPLVSNSLLLDRHLGTDEPCAAEPAASARPGPSAAVATAVLVLLAVLVLVAVAVDVAVAVAQVRVRMTGAVAVMAARRDPRRFMRLPSRGGQSAPAKLFCTPSISG